MLRNATDFSLTFGEVTPEAEGLLLHVRAGAPVTGGTTRAVPEGIFRFVILAGFRACDWLTNIRVFVRGICSGMVIPEGLRVCFLTIGLLSQTRSARKDGKVGHSHYFVESWDTTA